MMKNQGIFILTVLSVLSGAATAEESEPSKLRYIVTGAPAKSKAQLLGADVKVEIPEMNLYAVEFKDEASLAAMQSESTKMGFDMEPDLPRYLIPGTESDPSMEAEAFVEQIPWGISRTYELNGVPNIPDPSYFPGASDIQHPICVIDSGYQKSHDDLPDDAVAADPNQSNSAFRDTCDHGTHVSGTIAATGGNGIGVVGVFPAAPGVRVVKTFDNFIFLCLFTYTSGLLAAAQACANAGSSIITMSLGGSGASTAERNGFQSLYDQGILSIAASGNGGNRRYSYPAAYDSVMSVGATDINDNIASFSTYNDQVEISGPGVNVRSTVPANGYANYDGTSMATPHVSGAALVLWNKFPTATNAEVRAALIGGAIDLGATGRDDFFGYGLLNYWNSEAILSGGCFEDPSQTIIGVLNPTSSFFATCGQLAANPSYVSTVCALDPVAIATANSPAVQCPTTCGTSGGPEDPTTPIFALLSGTNVQYSTCGGLATLPPATISVACSVDVNIWNEYDASAKCCNTCP